MIQFFAFWTGAALFGLGILGVMKKDKKSKWLDLFLVLFMFGIACAVIIIGGTSHLAHK